MFGDGTLAACKPISEQDLAAFIADCVTEVGRGAGWQRRCGEEILVVMVGTPVPSHPRQPQLADCRPHGPLPAPPAQKDKINQVLPIGGPGEALTAKDQAELLFRILGKEPKYFPVPVALMDGIIGILDLLAKIFPGLKVGSGWRGSRCVQGWHGVLARAGPPPPPGLGS
jgi:divinyl chlorophyllide a 8-vinyl-reductase